MDSRSVTKDTSWSWLVSIGALVAMMIETGIVKCLGVLLPELCEEFQTDTWVIGLAISLSAGFGVVTGVISIGLRKKVSNRAIVMTYAIISTVGIILISRSSTIPMFYFAMILSSFSFGCESVSFAALPDYFDKYYDVSNGIAHAGMAVGIMFLPPLTQFLFSTYGLKGSILVIAGVNFHLTVTGALLRPTTNSTDKNNGYSLIEEPKWTPSHLFDFQLFFNIDLICILLINTACGYYFTGWLIYLVSHAQDVGISPYAAATLATFGGLGNLTGSCIYPLIARVISNKAIIYLSNFLVFLSLVIDPLLCLKPSYIGLAISSFVVNVGEALTGCSTFKEVYNVIGQRFYTGATNFMFCSYSIGSLCSGFLSGWFYDKFGNYTASFLLLSFVPLLSLAPMAIKDYQQRQRHN